MFRWPVRVYYEDTDAGGVVYHAQYVAFFERARTELLRHLGFHQQRLLQDNIAFVVRRITVDYLMPARFDDLLMSETEITLMRGASLTFAQRLLDSQGNLLSHADVLIACVDLHQMKPIALPKSIVSEFKQWLK